MQPVIVNQAGLVDCIDTHRLLKYPQLLKTGCRLNRFGAITAG